MKSKLNFRFSMALLSVLLLSNSFAQKDFSNATVYSYPSNQSMITFPSPENNLMIKEDVNKKVLKHFNKTFRNSENIKWGKLDDNFLATFTKDILPPKRFSIKKVI
ncbi:MAG: hypothetical protein ABI472_14215 [Ginsengibacter sp.]